MGAVDLICYLIGIDAAGVVEKTSMDGFLKKMGIEFKKNLESNEW